jgi:hydrogenase nickel incorporation protein HypA/HybF
MHELSIIASLFDTLESQAREHKANRITSVTLQVGPLAGVVPELLREAFDMYKKGTVAEEAELFIVQPTVKVRCRICGAETEREDYILSCRSCGSPDIALAAGGELFLEKLELEID